MAPEAWEDSGTLDPAGRLPELGVGGGFPSELAGRYAKGRMWSIWPLEAPEELQKAWDVFGLGDEPGHVVVTGSEWASTPATGMGTIDPGLPMGDVVDAVVYHGNVPDSIVGADLSVLEANYGAELDRRRRLLLDAFKLLQSRR